MDSIVQGLAEVYDFITLIVARGAYWLSVVLLYVAAARRAGDGAGSVDHAVEPFQGR